MSDCVCRARQTGKSCENGWNSYGYVSLPQEVSTAVSKEPSFSAACASGIFSTACASVIVDSKYSIGKHKNPAAPSRGYIVVGVRVEGYEHGVSLGTKGQTCILSRPILSKNNEWMDQQPIRESRTLSPSTTLAKTKKTFAKLKTKKCAKLKHGGSGCTVVDTVVSARQARSSVAVWGRHV